MRKLFYYVLIDVSFFVAKIMRKLFYTFILELRILTGDINFSLKLHNNPS